MFPLGTLNLELDNLVHTDILPDFASEEIFFSLLIFTLFLPVVGLRSNFILLRVLASQRSNDY